MCVLGEPHAYVLRFVHVVQSHVCCLHLVYVRYHVFRTEDAHSVRTESHRAFECELTAEVYAAHQFHRHFLLVQPLVTHVYFLWIELLDVGCAWQCGGKTLVQFGLLYAEVCRSAVKASGEVYFYRQRVFFAPEVRQFIESEVVDADCHVFRQTRCQHV